MRAFKTGVLSGMTGLSLGLDIMGLHDPFRDMWVIGVVCLCLAGVQRFLVRYHEKQAENKRE